VNPLAVKNLSTSRVLIIGTGIAGLSCALKFAQHSPETNVVLVCKRDPLEGATRYAQGGIASVWSNQDSVEEHKQDTLLAGAGLCHEATVDLCVREGPRRVKELIELGVPFTKTELGLEYDLHREGGHGKPRILHADDLTGLAIMNTLLENIRKCKNIQILENHIAIDLITEGKILKRWRKSGRSLGAYVLNSQTGEIFAVAADLTILATGGSGKVYLYTTNPDTATGDGVAMASRAGARIANMEFFQFHPTCLYHPQAKNFLITEALRGEGAILKTLKGDEFMSAYHPMASLAPRDIVARTIDLVMKRTGEKHVFLDATTLGAENIKRKFPNIYETCLRFGLDITRDPIPVVPAAHYQCGGVLVDRNGQSTIENLYAVGEVACTGLHGANRLASNSLLEACVFAEQIFQHGVKQLTELSRRRILTSQEGDSFSPLLPKWDSGRAVPLEEQLDIASNWLEIRTLMWNYVGIVRSDHRLERARRRLLILKEEIYEFYWEYILTEELVELRNILTISELIVESAIQRKESRGLHFNVDCPEKDDLYFLKDTLL
jgi:L-aspartate oxidase